MPLHKAKSRVRFQRSGLQVKQGGDRRAQNKPTRTNLENTSRSAILGHAVDETLFERKDVPSTDELGSLLHSALSTSLAAEKASLKQQDEQCSPSLPSDQFLEQLHVVDDDSSASLPELAPLTCTARDQYKTTGRVAVANESHHADAGSSTSLLATTARKARLKDHGRQKALAGVLSLTPEGRTHVSFDVLAKGSGLSQDGSSPTTDSSCAIADDDEEGELWSQMPTVTVPVERHQSAFLKWVVTLFAGRRRCRARAGVPQDQIGEQEESTTPSNSYLQPAVESPYYSVCSEGRTAVASRSSSPLCPPPPQPEPPHFTRADADKNLPLPSPTVVLKSQHSYQPSDLRLDQPVIQRTKHHELFGNYYVAPDTFTPEIVHVGFPGTFSSTAFRTHLSHNCARFLDRDNTVWGKWYAKHPNPEDMPFSADYKGPEEATEQEA